MQVVLTTGPDSQTTGRLVFADPQWVGYRDNSGYFGCTLTMTLGEDERSVEVEQIPPYVSDMVGFFEDMARHASGWSGVMSWASEDAEIRLGVRNPEGEAVRLDFLMRWPPTYEDEWPGTFEVSADVLPRAAKAMKKLTGETSGHRFITPGRPPTWQPL